MLRTPMFTIAGVVLMGTVMLLLMWRGQSPFNGIWLLLPMALCVGMHLLMHRHGPSRDRPHDD